MYSGNPLELLKTGYDVYNAGKTAYDWYQRWAQEQTTREHQQLWQSVANFLNQGDYEKALPLLQQLTQKFSYDKARSLYLSAWCYFKLHRRDEALQACESAIQSSPSEELLQDIFALKAKIKFGLGFWIQWLIVTVGVGAISLFGTVGFLGEQYESSTAGLLGVLSMGISIGLAQWLLTRLRVRVGIWSLIINVTSILVILTISAILLTVNVWLSLLSLLGCMVIFTTLSIGRSVKQLEELA
jgi:tetratricopeptide (TPR) repeat protein